MFRRLPISEGLIVCAISFDLVPIWVWHWIGWGVRTTTTPPLRSPYDNYMTCAVKSTSFSQRILKALSGTRAIIVYTGQTLRYSISPNIDDLCAAAPHYPNLNVWLRFHDGWVMFDDIEAVSLHGAIVHLVAVEVWSREHLISLSHWRWFGWV